MFTSVLQESSDHPAAHVHENDATCSLHVAPFMHGDDAHSSSSTAQFSPL
jgi:hypothetical protein